MDNTLISRGKCTKAVNVSRYITGDWVQGYYVCLNKTTHRIYTGFADTKPEICPEYLEIDPKTLGSCAGFTDKKGGLVFEGDIIKLDEECCGVDTFVVKYGVFRSIDEDVDAFALGFYAEYIGNI